MYDVLQIQILCSSAVGIKLCASLIAKSTKYFPSGVELAATIVGKYGLGLSAVRQRTKASDHLISR